MEQWASDALAVLDDQGIERAAVLGVHFGGLAAMLLAATHPERVHALVFVNGYACLTRSDDYPFGVPDSCVGAIQGIADRARVSGPGMTFL